MADITKEEMRNRLGNITQLQELLFGEQIKQYDRKFKQTQIQIDKLESDLNQVHLTLEQRLSQLEKSFTRELKFAVDSLEKKLKYLSLTTQDETSKLKQEFKHTTQATFDNINSIQESLNTQTHNLKTEIIKTKQVLDKDIQFSRQQLLDKIEKDVLKLSDEKVSRGDLAEVLFELCLKVKGSDFVPQLQESTGNGVQTDFILPQEEADSEN